MMSGPNSIDSELRYLSDVQMREEELRKLNEEIVSVVKWFPFLKTARAASSRSRCPVHQFQAECVEIY